MLAWLMPIRRTREDKQEAEGKRYEIVKKGDVSINVANKVFFAPSTMSLDIKDVKADLTRTLVVTILALILQFALYGYLYNFAGWQKILNILKI